MYPFNMHINSKDRQSGNNNSFSIDWSNANFTKNKSYLVSVRDFTFDNNIIMNKNISFGIQELTPIFNINVNIPNGTYNAGEIATLIQSQLIGGVNVYNVFFDNDAFEFKISCSTFTSGYRFINVSTNAASQLGLTN